MMSTFDQSKAFSRNLGWLTPSEQALVQASHVGIVGLGGVGGQYAECLARLGVGEFTICDPDTFEVENTNRQNECRVSNYGKNKAQVIKELIQDINPEAKVTIIEGAMSESQVTHFCSAIDVYFDALDFFVMDLRCLIFRQMKRLNKPAITAAPIGTGSSCLVFTTGSMDFDSYFGIDRAKTEFEKNLRFLIGLAPSLQHLKYFQDRSKANIKEKRTPSLPMCVYSCASLATTSWLKIRIGRGRIFLAPYSVHYDPYLAQIKKTYMWLGFRNPFFSFKIFLITRLLPRDS